MAQPDNISCLWLFILVAVVALFPYHSNATTDEVPLSKLSQNVGAPTLKFLYCYSCGYRKMFDQYVTIINQKYPYLLVDGGNYDPPGLNMWISKILSTLKFMIILCILAGDRFQIFQFFNQPRPGWWTWCLENKLYACMMLFFLCNIIEGQLVQSGAFEISLNDVPVWSKLETGRIPQPAELFQIIDSHLQFTDSKIEFSSGFAK